MMEFCKEHDSDLYKDMNILLGDPTLRSLITLCKSENLQTMMDTFITQRREENKNFAMWWEYMRMVETLLLFTSGQRNADWNLTQHSFKCMLPYFFRYDHTNYARWGTVYVEEMSHLPEEVLSELRRGNFGDQWTEDSSFSCVDEDHATEWVNGIGTGAGGISGIRRQLRLYLDLLHPTTKTWFGVSETRKYSATPRQLKEDEAYEQRLYEEFMSAGMFTSSLHPDSLYNIATKDLASAVIEEYLLSPMELGMSCMNEFVTQRLIVPEGQENPPVSFSSRLRKISAPIFATLYDVTLDKSRKAEAAEVISVNRSILQRLVTAYDANRPVNLQEVAAHEPMNVPVTIFQPNGSMRSGSKSTLIQPLVGELQYTSLPQHSPDVSTLILDVMTRVQSISLPKTASNFGDFADVFVTSVFASGQNFNRIEAVGDRYWETSIKDCTRVKQSKCRQPSVKKTIDSRQVPLPATKKDFAAFLSVKENKTQLQEFMAEELISQAQADKIIVTAGMLLDDQEVRCSQEGLDLQHLCANHEEADTRIVLHCSQSE